MLVERIEQIANDRGFTFRIGDEHWQNLLDATDDSKMNFAEKKVYLLLFNDRSKRDYNDISIQNETQTVTFLLAVRSSLTDESFDYKYKNHIKPLKQLARQIEDEDFGVCEDLRIKSILLEGWRENYLDTNLDCVEVTITVSIDG